MNYYVYIITNKKYGTLYTGVTNNLIKRIFEHKNNFIDSFSSKYKLNKLVYYECFDNIEEAIKREKQIKNWHRQWKINIIDKFNTNWEDLFNKII